MDLYLATSASIHFSTFWITWDIVEVLKSHSSQKIDDPREKAATCQQYPRPANENRELRQLDYLVVLKVVLHKNNLFFRRSQKLIKMCL